MCSGDVGNAVLFQTVHNSLGRFRHDAPVPELPEQFVTEVMAIVHACVDISYGAGASFRQTA